MITLMIQGLSGFPLMINSNKKAQIVLQLFLKRSTRQQWGIFLAGIFLLLATVEAAFTWYVFRDGLNESVERSRDS
jgi:hypothetical protein